MRGVPGDASFAVTRVSSQKSASASERIRAARGERSSRFPIGVPTTKSRPFLPRDSSGGFCDERTAGKIARGSGSAGYPRRVKRFLAVAALAAALALGAEILDRIAATVNDVAIPESEVRRAMVVSALQPEPGESREAFRARVLDALIDQHLEYEDAQRFGSAPPDAAEIEASMRTLESRLRAEGKDPATEFTRAGLTREEVRAALERQLLIQRYLKERFYPVALADEEKAREEYEKFYTPERRAAGLAVPPFESVLEEVRRRAQERSFDEETEKWRRDLRQKARVGIYRIPVPLGDRRKVVLSSTSHTTPTPAPAFTPTP